LKAPKFYSLCLLLLVAIKLLASSADTLVATHEIKPSFFVIPYLNYQPETSWAPGLSGAYYFGSHDLSKISSLGANYSFSIKGQSMMNITPKIFFGNNHWMLYSNLSYRAFPDRFYGVGATKRTEYATYVYNTVAANVQLQYIWSQRYYLGMVIDHFSNLFPSKDLETSDPMYVESVFSNVEGLYAYTHTAVGLVGAYDSRDNQFYPHGGSFLKLMATSSSKGILSDYSIGEVTVDYRKYWQPFAQHILGVQFLYDGLFSNGAIPFQLMSTLGGMDVMRGIRQGMYRDRQMMVLQVEYRLPVYKRLKAAVFTSAGDVYDKSVLPQSMKFSGGVGLRYQYNKARVNIRLDVATSSDDFHPQIYFTASEAF
jgi:outer membrane protein assembly factor BamA